jgi:hypothetical protein
MENGRNKIGKTTLQDREHSSELEFFIEGVKGHKPMQISFDSLHATTLAYFKICESIDEKLD